MKKKINFLYHAKKIFYYNRSITGRGVRQSLLYFKKHINKNFKIKYFRSGEKFFDWQIPNEWEVTKATLCFKNEKILDFKKNNLSLIGYSMSKKTDLTLEQLKKNLYFNKTRPNATPYVTSYYYKNWGFCLPYNKYKKLKKGKYKIDIKTKFFKGKMNYGELYIRGKSKKEILVTSYLCHPSLANNELSGPLVIAALAKRLKPSKYSVRLILIPETIGAIAYIGKNLKTLKSNIVAGINITCVGKNGPHTIIKSLDENTYVDNIVKRLAKKINIRFLPFQNRGSNERQFGCQKLNIPFITYCRMKFGEYPEYHTSDDNLNIIDNKTLDSSTNFILRIINLIQKNKIYEKNKYCEPFLSKYNLWEKIRHTTFSKSTRDIFNLCAYTNRNNDSQDLEERLNIKKNRINHYIKILTKNKILKEFI